MLPILALSIPFLLYIFIPIKRSYRYVLAFLISVFVFSLFLPSLRQNHLLSRSGVQHVGVLTKKNCDTQNNPYVEYRFIANKAEIPGSGRLGSGNRSCADMRLGDQVFITYIPGNEAVSVPEREVKSSVALYIAGFLSLYIFLLWIGNAGKIQKQETIFAGIIPAFIRTRSQP